MFKGAFVAIVTPFDDNNMVQFDMLTTLLEWHITNQTDGIVILGTTGEAPTLSKDEKLAVFKHTVHVVNGRVPVIAGTGSNNTAETVLFSKEVEALGVDGLLIVSPYYNKGNKQGLLQHFTAVADAVTIPIMLYNVPSRTGVNIPVDVVVELSSHPNIVALKEASSDLSYAAQVLAQVPRSFHILSGNDDLVVPLLSLGGMGVVSVSGNVIPKQMHQIVQYYLDGDVESSRNLQLEYLELINALFIETNPIPVKTVLHHIGFNVGGYRLPLSPMAQANLDTLLQVCGRYNL